MPVLYSLNVGTPELVGQRRDVGLGGADEGAAGLDGRALAEVVVEHPAADAVAGLDEEDAAAAAGDLAGGDQPGDAAAHDDHVDLAGQGALQRGVGGVQPGERAGAGGQAAEGGAAEEGAAGEREGGHVGSGSARDT